MDSSPLESVFESLGSLVAASLSPVIAPAALDASPGIAPPSPPGTVGSRDNYQGTGGVRFQGFDGEALVSLVIVDLREDGNKTCFGAIGSTKRSGRFCVRVGCSIAAHRTKEKTLEEWRNNGIAAMLCVRVPSSKTVEAAFIDPALPIAQMTTDDYSLHLTESRSLNNWVMIFAQLRGIIRDRADDPDDSQPISSLAQRLERASAALPTPAKRGREMEDLDENSALSVSLLDLPPDEFLVTNDADRVLLKNQNMLKGALDDVNDALKSLISTAVQMEGFKQQSSDKMNALEGGIGKRPQNYAAPTVWQALRDLGEDIVVARTTIGHDLSAKARQQLEDIGEHMNKNMLYVLESKLKEAATSQQLSEAITKLESRVAAFLKQTLEAGLLPSIQSLTRVEIPKIQTRLELLEKKRPAAAASTDLDDAAAMLSNFDFGNAPPVKTPQAPAPTDDAAFTKLNEKYEVLLARISDLESRSEERAVQVGGKWFTSKAQVQSWLQSEQGEDRSAVGLMFLDAVSEMQLMHLDFGSIGQRMDQEHKGNRLELDDPTYQTVFFSYSVEVPECMGDSTMIASQNPNVLNKLKTYADFAGNGDFDDGLVNLWNSKLDEMDSSFVSTVERAGVSATMTQLAIHLHRSSRAFLRALFAFITKQYEAYGASTGLKPAVRWGLVQKLVRIVWSDIAKVRRRASSITLRNAKSSSPEYMWSCFQAHRVMAEYMEKGFSHHPSIAPILTGYLLKIVAFREDLAKSAEALQKMQAHMDKTVKSMQDSIAKAAADAKVAREKATQALSKSPKKKARREDDDE
jgi:hypothetical protein